MLSELHILDLLFPDGFLMIFLFARRQILGFMGSEFKLSGWWTSC